LPLSRSAIYSRAMRRNRWRTIALGVVLLWPHPVRPQVVDCLAAEVNGRAITLTDLRILRAFSPDLDLRPGVSQQTLRETLEETIDRRAVIELIREDIEVTEKESADLLALWKGRWSAGQWQERLAAYGLQEEALRPYLEEIIRYSKIIEFRFGREIEISPPEVERYYEEVYRPSEMSAGREPRPLAEAALDLEARIRWEKSEQLAAPWVRSLRAQAEVRIIDRCLEQASGESRK
jgi:hypothetical protein